MAFRSTAMGLGLRAVNRIGGSALVDRLGLRKPAEKALYHGSRLGFRGADTLARGLKATQKLLKPARLPHQAAQGLFDLTPTDEQQMLRDAAAAYAAEQLRPAADGASPATASPMSPWASASAINAWVTAERSAPTPPSASGIDIAAMPRSSMPASTSAGAAAVASAACAAGRSCSAA